MAKTVVTALEDWRKIAELSGADPSLIMHDPGTNELECPDVTQTALDAGHAAYTADQANIDAATAAAEQDRTRSNAEIVPDSEKQDGMGMRSIIETFNKRDNYLTNRILQLQQAMDDMKASTGAADSIRDAIPAVFLPTATRPRNDAIQDYKDEITSGNADN